jgi:kynureninase
MGRENFTRIIEENKTMTIEDFKQKALKFDKNDKLAHFRNQFEIGGEIYLDGNSLGRLPKKTIEISTNLIKNQWGKRLIRSWNEHWIELPNKVAAKIAQIVGARPDEIFVGDSTSINFYKMAFAALRFQNNRSKITTDSLNFPTDIYVLQGLIEQHFKNHSLSIIKSNDEISISDEAIEQALDENTALLTLSHVVFKSAYQYNMQKINDLAHKKGALVLWDLSHSAGAVPVNLNESDADMAVGCTYKYLNGGPGAPAFLYVRRDLQEKLSNPIWAWFSHEKPFDFTLDYTAKNDIQRFASGTPSVLSLGAIEAGLDIMLEAGMLNLREKSVAQSSFLIEIFLNLLKPLGFTIASPLNANERGSHISIQHQEGYKINRAMIEPIDGSPSIIPDFRPPNNIRLGIAPLYNTFEEIFQTIVRIKKIVETKEFERFGDEKLTVV